MKNEKKVTPCKADKPPPTKKKRNEPEFTDVDDFDGLDPTEAVF